MSQSEFPRHLIDELDRLLIQIRTLNDQAEALVSRARDIAALAKRSVSEDVKAHVISMKAEEAIRQADTAIEREVQREVERRERSIEQRRVVPRGGTWADDARLRTIDRKAQRDAAGLNIHPTDDDLHSAYDARLAGGVVLPKDMPAAERAAIIQDIAELSGRERKPDIEIAPGITCSPDTPDDVLEMYREGAREMLGHAIDPNELGLVMPLDAPTQPIVDPTGAFTLIDVTHPAMPEPATIGVDLGAGDLTVDSLYVGDRLVSSRIVDETGALEEPVDEPNEPEQDAPASGVATEQEIPAAPQSGVDDTGADEEQSPPADSSAPVDQTVEVVDRAPAEPPKSLQQIADRFYRERPETAAKNRESDKFYEEVMLLWSTTMLTENQIAKRLLTTKALVTTILERARADGDDRINRKTFKAKPEPVKQEPAMPSKGTSAPPPNKPFIANTGVTFEEDAMPPAHHKHISTGICVVDLETNKVYGKTGYWTTSPEVARTIAKLNRGQMFSADLIQRDCGWPTMDHLRRAITTMIERLRDCSIELVHLPVGMKINRIDAGKR